MTVVLYSSLTAVWFLWTNQSVLIHNTANEFASFCMDNSFGKWPFISYGERIHLTCFLLKQTKFWMICLSIAFNRNCILFTSLFSPAGLTMSSGYWSQMPAHFRLWLPLGLTDTLDLDFMLISIRCQIR